MNEGRAEVVALPFLSSAIVQVERWPVDKRIGVGIIKRFVSIIRVPIVHPAGKEMDFLCSE